MNKPAANLKNSSSLLPPLLLVLLAGVSGFFPIKLLFGVGFLTVGLFGYIGTALFGPAWGITAAIAGSFPTLFYWGHPYAIILYTIEAAAVAWLTCRRGIGLTFSDISDNMHAQESLLLLSFELSQEKERIEIQRNITQSILEATREGMLLCGSDGRILFTNSRLKDFFGDCSLDAETINELINSLPGLNSDFAALLLQDLHSFLQRGGTEASLRRNFPYSVGQQIFYYSLYAAPIKESSGLEGSHLLVFRDRTEEEQQEVLKEELVNQISHELRTPLTSILGFSEIMNNRVLPPNRQKRYTETIYNEAVRLSRLVDNFLDLQRMEGGHQRYFYVPLDIRELALETAKQWHMEKKQQLHLTLPDEPAFLLADADRMKQALHNLVSNAFKYSPEGTPVTLQVRHDNGIIYVDVSDKGLGIPESEKEKIFRKFYRVAHPDRRKIPGSGLGLAIVKEIVEAHNGEITFRSQHGVGSVFSIWMPAYHAQETDGKLILIERDEDYAEELTAAVEKQGLQVLKLRSFEEVLFAVYNGSGAPRFIAADLVGAGLMNGLEFAALLRHSPAGLTPLIFLEAMNRGSPGHNREGVKFTNKAFSPEELTDLITRKNADTRTYFRCCFPLQDKGELKAQLAKFGLVPEWLVEDAACLCAHFPKVR